ncbi:thioredoxin family protein [Hellea sp.]|jgi:thioredoxin-related protein|nr:thioredoxin family protein [Hellea sp.]MBT3593687.1 thioredoxin family protein [Hellea sp.]MBT7398665.1 thioredoxin family protein [Hellea sp.]MDA8888100.1 thioredoxin family protein [Hellea sp.]MDB4844571.1 thioredoxin family protein [Hellea sp.]MDC0422535.1 thioredoxin family protein [Hellea sp.]
MCKYLLLLLFAFLLIGSCSAYPDYNKYSNVPTQKSDNMYTPYNETDEAETEINYLLDIIKNEQKHGLIVFGANWCHDSRSFAATLNSIRFEKLLKNNYEILYVDVGDKDKNINLIRKYGVQGEFGTPTVFVINSNGRVLNLNTAVSWRNAHSIDDDYKYEYLKSFIE